jgi:hypothetical protein
MKRHACSAFERARMALTGMVLFGNLAQRTGRPIKWDTEQRTTNAMEAVALIWPLYRPT